MLHLASRSPRRAELLGRLGLPFGIIDLDIPELRGADEAPADYVRRVAREKAGAGLLKVVGVADALVLGSDTEVILDDVVFGKPADATEAADMLRRLSARGVKVAIVSSNSEAVVRRVLGPELAGLVAHYGCGASIFGKAAKFRQVIRAAGVADADVLSVGDEVRDIEAARKVRLAAGAVTWGYATPEILQAQRPSAMFETTDDVLREAGLCGI